MFKTVFIPPVRTITNTTSTLKKKNMLHGMSVIFIHARKWSPFCKRAAKIRIQNRRRIPAVMNTYHTRIFIRHSSAKEAEKSSAITVRESTGCRCFWLDELLTRLF